MMRKLFVLGGALGLFLFFVAFVAIMGSLRPEVETREAEPVAPIAFVREVAYEPMVLTVESQGEVRPRREIQLSAQIAGRIESVSPSFANGGVFKAGDTLVTIESADYALAVTRARAQVAQARQRLAVEEAESALAARDYEELSGQDAGSDPSLLALRKPQLAAAQADLASAQANLADAELALERTRITAPFDGRVRSINANTGQYVTPGMNLGQVFSTNVAEIRLPLTDADLGKLGLPFAFEAKTKSEAPAVKLSATVAGQERSWDGRIRRIDAAIDSSTRQIAAIAEVEDPYGAGSDDGFPLAFGLFVDAKIEGPKIDRGTVVPLLALKDDNVVYVADAEDRIVVREPQIIARAGEGVIVTGGIEEGEKLIISPVAANPGGQVRPLYEDGESASSLPPEQPSEDEAPAEGDAATAAAADQAGASL